MNQSIQDVLKLALELAIDERARLAAELMASLDDAVEEKVEAPWAEEIERRVLETRAGNTESTDWRTVIDLVEKEVLDR
jgi:putative addiction module component (TIGR02574 family)